MRGARRGRWIALPVGLVLLAASGCWKLASDTPEVQTTSLGIPVTVCDSPTKTSDHEYNAALVIDWGDGTQDEADIYWDNAYGHCRSHRYAAPGEYHGSVSVHPGQETMDHRSLLVVVADRDPGYLTVSGTCTCHNRATFSAANLEAVLGTASSGEPNEYRWDFGDGIRTVTTSPTVTHTYARRTTHTVTVEAVRPFFIGWGEVRHGYAEADAMTTVRIGS